MSSVAPRLHAAYLICLPETRLTDTLLTDKRLTGTCCTDTRPTEAYLTDTRHEKTLKLTVFADASRSDTHVTNASLTNDRQALPRRCSVSHILSLLDYCYHFSSSGAESHLLLLDRVVSGTELSCWRMFLRTCDLSYRRKVSACWVLSKIYFRGGLQHALKHLLSEKLFLLGIGVLSLHEFARDPVQ